MTNIEITDTYKKALDKLNSQIEKSLAKQSDLEVSTEEYVSELSNQVFLEQSKLELVSKQAEFVKSKFNLALDDISINRD